jgi:O-antigen/teichoic acid export membrane protein
MISFLKRKINNLISDKRFSEILTGSAYALVGRVGGTGLGLVVSIIIARCYGAEAVGIVALLNSFLLLAAVFTVLGTNTSILRLIPEHLVKHSPSSAFKVYRKTQFLVIGVSLITGVLFFFCSGLISQKVFSKPNLSFYFAFAAVFVVFKSLMLLNTHAVRALRLMKTFAFMLALPVLSNLVLLVLLTLFLYKGDNPIYAYLGSLAITGTTGWVVMECAFKRRIQPRDSIRKMRLRAILTISLPMLMTALMGFAISQTGVIMLGMSRSEAEVGYYSVAVRVATVTLFVLQAINAVAAPKFSELFHAGRIDDLFHVARKSSKLIFWAVVPILTAMIFFGKPGLTILFGADFAAGYLPLVILAIGQFVNSISGATGLFMNMTGHEITLSKILVCSALMNIIINLILIPALGMIGAALGAMTSLSFWNICTLLYIRRKYGQTIGYFPFPLGFSKRSL